MTNPKRLPAESRDDSASLTIAPCPNPECTGACHIVHTTWPETIWQSTCIECGYFGSEATSESEAIRLHNAIARNKAERPASVPVEKLQELQAKLSRKGYAGAVDELEALIRNAEQSTPGINDELANVIERRKKQIDECRASKVELDKAYIIANVLESVTDELTLLIQNSKAGGGEEW